MAAHSELQITIRELHQARLDLGRARLILATAKQLVSEERAEINQLRADLKLCQQQSQRRIAELEWENDSLRVQLRLKACPMEDT